MSGPQGPDSNWGAQPGYPQYGQPSHDPYQSQQPTEYGAQGYPQYGQPSAIQPYQPQAPTEYGAQNYQYNPYGQQPSAPANPYGQQPGQYGQFQQPGQPPQGSKSSTKLILGVVGAVAAVVIAAVAVTGFWKPGFFVTTKLDVDKAQAGVQQVLTDETSGYGAKNVKDVKCNNGQSPVVKKGDTFSCDVSIDGSKRQVTVTFQDDKGTYEVGRPK